MDQVFIEPISDTGSTHENFSCCSRYRQCSDQKKCVNPDRELAAMCQYRKNLEAGRIFYGKSTISFDPAVYDVLLAKINSFPAKARIALYQLADYCFRIRYLSDNFLVHYSPVLDQIALIDVVDFYNDERSILDLYSYQYLRKAAGISARKKADVIESIIKDRPDLCARLTSPYRFVRFRLDMRRYLHEAYLDGNILPAGTDDDIMQDFLPLIVDDPLPEI